jgi:hypothetical protein
VDGIAVHWYTDRWFPLPDALDTVHEEYPDKFILYTEACTGEMSLNLYICCGMISYKEFLHTTVLSYSNHFEPGSL